MKPPIMSVSEKNIFWGGDVGYTMINTNSTITNIIIMNIPPNILWIIGPACSWMTHVWVFPTLRWHKTTTINPKINFLGGKVGGPRTRTAFDITVTNTKCRKTPGTNWIIPNVLWIHGGSFVMTLIWPKSPIIPVFA